MNEKCCVLDSQEKLTSGAEIPKRKSRSFIVFLVLVAFSTSLYRLGGQSLWWDETLSVQRARGDLGYVLSNTIYIFNDATKDQHPPLYFLLLHFSRMAFGDSEFALRFTISKGIAPYEKRNRFRSAPRAISNINTRVLMATRASIMKGVVRLGGG
ncbi:MAG: hypothetical protein M1343_04260 [Chloroflexi bacterium]|nr:hypothetical protein [Chloroflexota bacterium]